MGKKMILGFLVLIVAFALFTYYQNLLGKRLDARYISREKPVGDFVTIEHQGLSLNIHYMEQGKSAEGGQNIILVHGFMGSLDSFENMVPHLAENNKVYRIDNIGFGKSYNGLDISYSKQSMAEVLIKFIDTMGIEDPVVIGHSMGGEIAVRAVISSPQKIEKLVLINPAGLQKRRELNILIKTFPRVSSFLANKIAQTPFVVGRSLDRMIYDKSRVSIDRYEDYVYWVRRVKPGVVFKMTEDMDKKSIEDQLGKVKAPVLIIGSTHDKLIALEDFQKIHGRIKRSEIVIIEDCGHIPFEEKPHHVIDEIQRFLRIR